MNIRTFGNGERLFVCRDLLSDSPVLKKYTELVIFPIPTTKDSVYITGTDVKLADAAEAIGEGAFVLGYGIPEKYVEMLEVRGAVVCDAMGDEIFLSRNAELTALGTVGVILTGAKKSVSDLRVGIIGYGRIGRRLLRILLFLGAHVRVYTRKNSTRLDLCSCGIDAEMSEGGDFSGLDFLINTAPERILGASELSRLLEGGKIIDLASGDNFPSLDGISKLGGIPGLMYPVSAGRIYAEAALRYEGGEDGC